MKYLPNDLKYLIFEFSDNKSMALISNDFFYYLNDIRKDFLKLLDKDKLFIEYQLKKYKRYVYGSYYSEKKFLISELPKKLIIKNLAKL